MRIATRACDKTCKLKVPKGGRWTQGVTTYEAWASEEAERTEEEGQEESGEVGALAARQLRAAGVGREWARKLTASCL